MRSHRGPEGLANWNPVSERLKWQGVDWINPKILRQFRELILAYQNSGLSPFEDDPGAYLQMRGEHNAQIETVVASIVQEALGKKCTRRGQLQVDPFRLVEAISSSLERQKYIVRDKKTPQLFPTLEILGRLTHYFLAHAFTHRTYPDPLSDFFEQVAQMSTASILALPLRQSADVQKWMDIMGPNGLALNDEDPNLTHEMLKHRNNRLSDIMRSQTAKGVPLCVMQNDSFERDKLRDMQLAPIPDTQAVHPRFLAQVNYIDVTVGLVENPRNGERFLSRKSADGTRVASLALSNIPFHVNRNSYELSFLDMGPETLQRIMGARRYELVRWDILRHLIQLVCRTEALPTDLFDMPKITSKTTEPTAISINRSDGESGESSDGLRPEIVAQRIYPNTLSRRFMDALSDQQPHDSSEFGQPQPLTAVVAHTRLLPVIRRLVRQSDGTSTLSLTSCRPSEEAQRAAVNQGICLRMGIELIDLKTGATIGIFSPDEVSRLLLADETIEDLVRGDPNAFVRYETWVDGFTRGDSEVGVVVGVVANTVATVLK